MLHARLTTSICSSALLSLRRSAAPLAIASLLGVTALPQAHADTIGSTTVAATTSVYATPTQTYGGTAQVVIPIAAGTTQITFSVSETSRVTVNSGGNYNDPDGVGSAQGEYNTGTSAPGNNLSSINSPTAGYLAGAFTDGTESQTATGLDYTSSSSVNSASYSPTLDQVFFIGDGLTGDGTGSTQIFYVPTGATELVLGLADACGYYGGPSCLTDNSGSFSVSYDESGAATPPTPPASAVPEPSSLFLLGTGMLGLAGSASRRLRAHFRS